MEEIKSSTSFDLLMLVETRLWFCHVVVQIVFRNLFLKIFVGILTKLPLIFFSLDDDSKFFMIGRIFFFVIQFGRQT